MNSRVDHIRRLPCGGLVAVVDPDWDLLQDNQNIRPRSHVRVALTPPAAPVENTRQCVRLGTVQPAYAVSRDKTLPLHLQNPSACRTGVIEVRNAWLSHALQLLTADENTSRVCFPERNSATFCSFVHRRSRGERAAPLKKNRGRESRPAGSWQLRSSRRTSQEKRKLWILFNLRTNCHNASETRLGVARFRPLITLTLFQAKPS
jgi:hypothetical protein